jgi:hypothetical protein
MSLILKRISQGTVLYLVKREIKVALQNEFSYNYAQNQNGVLIFVDGVGRKHRYVPQLDQTEKTDFENALSRPKCFALCVNRNSTLCQCKLVCQMHAAQLLMARCSPNAQQTSSLLCDIIYKINPLTPNDL